MNFISPLKAFKNIIDRENENSRIENLEKNTEQEFQRNMNLLLFQNSIQNFLRLDNSTEEIKIDFNAFLTNFPNIENNNQFIEDPKSIFFSDIYYFEMEFESIHYIYAIKYL